MGEIVQKEVKFLVTATLEIDENLSETEIATVTQRIRQQLESARSKGGVGVEGAKTQYKARVTGVIAA